MPNSIVLLSAGLDSTVNLKCALNAGSVKALTFDYGQRAARREKEAAAAMCARHRIEHHIISIPWLGRITSTALVKKDKSIPRPASAQLDNLKTAKQTAAQVWVPNRNSIFLAIGAAFAESFDADQVVPGFNAEEAATFPDNSPEFIRAFNQTLRFSTHRNVRVKCYTTAKRKAAILRLGLRIAAPLDLVWCCYEGKRKMCGKCESCLRFLRAIEQTRATDWFQKNHQRMPPQFSATDKKDNHP